jgi:hypothetical protein
MEINGLYCKQQSTTKTGRHDIAEILLKVALNTIKIKIIVSYKYYSISH